MSADLERRMRAARERWVDAAGVQVKVRRPLPLELAELHETHETSARREIVVRYVVDWKVTEADLLPGVGGEEVAPFSAGAWREFVLGRVDLFAAVVNAIMGWYHEHQAAVETVPGKSESS
jgi:hypothetical protein